MITIHALSIDYNTFMNKLLLSYSKNLSEYPAIFCCQGYSEDEKYSVNKFIVDNKLSKCKVIFDDAVYNKGLTISEIRDYFITTYHNLFNTEWTFVTDDDHYYNEGASEVFEVLNQYTDDEIGLIEFKRKSNKADTPYREYANPYAVGLNAGLLVRSELLKSVGFGSKYKIRYWEECYLATLIYSLGYEVLSSNKLDVSYRNSKSGITRRLQDQYGKYLENVPNSGWEVLSNLGMYTFKSDRHRNDSRYVTEMNTKLHSLHIEGLKKLILTNKV